MAGGHIEDGMTARRALDGSGRGLGWKPSPWVSRLAALVSYATTSGLFLGSALVSIARGWRPTSDDALLAWRAWNVISRRPPLLGAPTHGDGTAHQVFAPGPALSWLLALPTHAEPRWGPLLGSAVLAAALAAVAVAAARSWRGDLAGILAALTVVLVCGAERPIALNPLWTPWVGVLALVAALACALPTTDGRLGWATGLVATASIAAQAHVIYVLPAAVVGVTALTLGTVAARRSGDWGRRSTRALTVAGAVGLLLWLPTVVAEVADTPGNLALLWDTRGGGPTLGTSFALHGMASAVAPDPSWLHAVPQMGPAAVFQAFTQLFGDPVGWALAALAVLVGAVWWGTARRHPGLRNLALVTLAADLAAVAAVAAIPRRDLLELGYLGVVFLPLGILTWATSAWLVVSVVAALVGRTRTGPGPRPTDRAACDRRAGDVAVLVACAGLAAVTGLLASRLLAEIPSDTSLLGGPAAVRQSDRVASQAARAVPPGTPFRFVVTGRSDPLGLYAAQAGAAYQLHVAGWRPQFPLWSANADFGITTAPAVGLRTVTCDVDGSPCRVERGPAPGG